MAKATCIIDGCDKPIRVKSRGWCWMHYGRWYRNGDPLLLLRATEERFWSKVNKNGPVPEYKPELGPCWLWTRALDKDGYGRFTYEGRPGRAYRVAYQIFVGPIPDGLQIDHLCQVHACVKAVADEHGPAHLEPVTQLVNVLRSEITMAGRNARKTHCLRGHPFDLLNTYWHGERRHCRTCRAERDRQKYKKGLLNLG